MCQSCSLAHHDTSYCIKETALSFLLCEHPPWKPKATTATHIARLLWWYTHPNDDDNDDDNTGSSSSSNTSNTSSSSSSTISSTTPHLQ